MKATKKVKLDVPCSITIPDVGISLERAEYGYCREVDIIKPTSANLQAIVDKLEEVIRYLAYLEGK